MRGFEQKVKDQTTEQSKLSVDLQSEQVERQFFEEVRQVKQMATGKPYLLHCSFGGNRFAFLTRIWRSVGAFTNLLQSVVDAAKYYAANDGDPEQWLFGVQFEAPEANPSPSYQIKQLLEPHRMAEPAMKDVCVRLWPAESLPTGYFALTRRLNEAAPRIEALRCSSYMKGAQMSFARTMVHFPGMSPLKMATDPPPTGKEHSRPELYFISAMEGARAIESQCSKDVLLE
ncbi:hypothetical protein ZWY2020_044048 [Hordeum vulgare]|nr:hypothetical protein ZWY2020_044048 [Hordeum vulgare]